MSIKRVNTIKKRLVSLAVIIMGSPIILAFANNHDQKFQSNHKVFIAFGFHVNLSHSFRNHSNDESGFGKDIRIIRRIIQTLDRFNDQGIPVKGIWDFDNLFSLQEIDTRRIAKQVRYIALVSINFKLYGSLIVIVYNLIIFSFNLNR